MIARILDQGPGQARRLSLVGRPPPTEGARDARGPKGPTGLDASRHRGLSKSCASPFALVRARAKQNRKSAKTLGVPRAMFNRSAPRSSRGPSVHAYEYATTVEEPATRAGRL